MIWSREQQRLLGAMGYELLARAGLEPSGASAARPGPAEAPAAATAVGRPTGLAALRRAVLRAAGEREVDSLIPDFERLRREPALKRALWPRLRALRRSH